MPEKFVSIGQFINNDPGFSKIRKVIKDADIIIDFGKIFPDLGKIITPVKAEKGVLFLRVESSVWRSELKFKEKIIVDKINNYFKEEVIKRIKFIS